MPGRGSSTFWDGDEHLSPAFRLRRMIEYAPFPALLGIPFAEVKAHLPGLRIDGLRTSEGRKRFLALLSAHLERSESWDEALRPLIEAVPPPHH